MLISDFLRQLETVVPLSAVGFARDSVGLQVGDESAELSAALFAYEVTPEIIAEARKRSANLIVSFHPLIFPNLSAVTDKTRAGHLVQQLIKNDIALYIQHTAFDTQPKFGTSILMAEALGLQNITTLTKIDKAVQPAFEGLNFGMGAIGAWTKGKKRTEVLRIVAETFKSSCVRYNSEGPSRIRTLAMLGGAGMDYYDSARAMEADAFITSDVRYHDFHRADHDKILLIDAGHAETESFVANGMASAARKSLDSNGSLSKAVNLYGHDAKRLLLLAHSEPNAVQYYCHGTNRNMSRTKRAPHKPS
jgi:dinuclear metal center YbgI/SA1388 family protein